MTIDEAAEALRDAAELPGVDAAFAATGVEVLDLARDGWPVATGESLDGWRVDVDGREIVLSNVIEYAEHIHGGAAAAAVEDDFTGAADALAGTIDTITAQALDLE